MKLKANTTRKIATPGERVNQGAWSMVSKAPRNMPPQVGVGGLTPTPRKLSEASSKIAEAVARLACTMTGAMQLGIRCLSMMRQGGAPMPVTAMMNSRSRTDSTWLRMTRATHGVPTMPTTRIMLNTAPPVMATRESASSKLGKADKPSMKRISTSSQKRPYQPAVTPMSTPTTTAILTPATPMIREMRAP